MNRVALRNQIRARMLAGDWEALQKEYRFKVRFVPTPDGMDLYWASLPVEINSILKVGEVDYNSKTRKFWYAQKPPVAPKRRRIRQAPMPSHHHRYTLEETMQYAKDRADFLKDNPWCQVAMLVRGEKVPATHVHHKKGRGPYYLDKDTFVATTREGDNWIHSNPDQARNLGLLA